MYDRLHPDEYMQYAPDEVDKQVSVNHEGCDAGLDTKRRLYVKRINSNRVVAFCQHCGKSGVHTSSVRSSTGAGTLSVALHRSTKPPTTGTGSSTVPTKRTGTSSKALHDPSDWPIAAKAWLAKYHIDTTKWRWFYEPTLGRLCYTLRDTEGVSVAKVCRGIEHTDPKYLNFKDDTDCPREFLGTWTDTLVITEDVVSAQRCVDAGLAAFPLLCTTLKDLDLAHLTGLFKNVILMLDNDNVDVHKKRTKLLNTLSILGCKVLSLVDTTDPKNYTHSELVTLLNEAKEKLHGY